MKTYQKITAFFLISAFGIFAFSCREPQAQNVNTTIAANSADAANIANINAAPPERIIEVQPSYAQTPTETYKELYAAVKAKDPERIKSYMTQQTLAFAASQAALQKKTLESIVENGFTATTFSDTLPEIRDERIKNNMGALEVRNAKENKWEDLPFMFEDGGWKLAIGEVFSGKYESPGKGQYQKEQEASNIGPGMIPVPDANNAPKMPNANK